MTVLDRLSLVGKTALITGGGSGLGQAMALSMADAGCDIAVAGRRREPLEETKGFVEGKGRRCFITQADVTDSEQVNRMVGEVIAEYGRVDILVNNAGGGAAGRGKTLLRERRVQNFILLKTRLPATTCQPRRDSEVD